MMFKLIWIIVGLCVLHIEPQSSHSNLNTIGSVQEQTSKSWRSATYKGLTVGQSTRADVLRIFGKPKRQDFAYTESENYPEVWYAYDDAGQFPGELIVAINKKTEQVISITLYPENLTKESAIERLGKDYKLKRYEFCPGFEEAEAAPLYESEEGNALFVEHRLRGIAINIGYGGRVNEVNFLPRPPA